MTAEQATTYLQALASSLTINVIVPLLLFLVMMAGLVWVLVRAQRDERFDAADFLRDDLAKLSYLRLAGLAALAMSSWVLAVETMNARMTPALLTVYLGAWSGALVFVKLAEKWTGVLPWTKQ